MTYEELMKCVKDVKIEMEYQPITKCPADPVICESTERTFLGEVGHTSNVIGQDDYRGLRALCFNAGKRKKGDDGR